MPDASAGEQEQGHSSYTAVQNKTSGRLIIHSSSLRFASRDGSKVYWVLPYDDMTDLEKQDRIVSKSIPSIKSDSGADLRIVSKAGKEWVLMNVYKRNEVFSQIIGFSSSNWKVVW